MEEAFEPFRHEAFETGPTSLVDRKLLVEKVDGDRLCRKAQCDLADRAEDVSNNEKFWLSGQVGARATPPRAARMIYQFQ